MSENSLRVKSLGIEVDALTQQEVIDEILRWCAQDLKGYIVTPNLDHLVKLRHDNRLVQAYQKAKLILADGMPIVWASRYGKGKKIPCRVTGSDLILPLCAAAEQQHKSVFLLGTRDEVLTNVTQTLHHKFPELSVKGSYSPPFGFEQDRQEQKRIIELINQCVPDIVFVALSPPKQEYWAYMNIDHLHVHALLCIGAGLDFIGGGVKRAPLWMQKAGLEWLWRVCREPKRLGYRYLQCLFYLPFFVYQHFNAK